MEAHIFPWIAPPNPTVWEKVRQKKEKKPDIEGKQS